jgi:hypothetical protein
MDASRAKYVTRCVTPDHAEACSPPFRDPEAAGNWMRRHFPHCNYLTTMVPDASR